MQASIQKISAQKGFSLIEALVAFLVLSVGMLGIASMQTMAIRAGETATWRSVAVVKAEEIMERIRTNKTVLSSYISATGDAGTNHGCDDLTGTVTTCTPVQLAEYDVFQWKQGLVEALPPDAVNTNGSIVVVLPAVPGQGVSTVTVTVNWREPRQNRDGSATNQTYSATANICGGITC